MDPYVGEIRLFSGNFAPIGWALCDGHLLPIQSYTALFSVIGATYGGDGKTNFAVPDLRGRAPMHWGNGPGLTPRTYSETGGEADVTLLENEIPYHTHTANAQTASDQVTPAATVWANAGAPGRGGFAFYTSTPDTPMNPLALSAAGGSQPHNNMQPYTVLTFIIALQGVYPPKQ
ncbi:phage tail protein [Paenibacillus rigui]|uniref:Phage tail protein n=1 Tax=Paenibacillus rigui TaxID=554312 RepID=A0A229UTC9_9BACL|nr:tail fiber protein [Paenibacillus rigui]OXM86652.1 phage tail protein [Paenibacillus rigui]